MREQRLPVDGELGSAGAAGEQPDAEVALQRRQTFRDGLLADPEVGGGKLELPFLGDRDKCPYRFQVHAHPYDASQPVVVFSRPDVVC